INCAKSTPRSQRSWTAARMKCWRTWRFPKAHRQQLHSTNALERLNAEIKRRTDIVGIFPNDPAITRLVGAMLLEQNDEWCLQRRYMQLEAFEAVSDNPQAKLSAVIK
ncbi:transposase, partial [Pseudomonas sp. SG-MS2]|uniref:transposase n=2 Tax=Pseudomonas TaxID=286 RepID=UPI001C4990A2